MNENQTGLRRLALALSFSVGLLSLSQEILWVRLLSFGQQGRPQAFAIVLAAFLLGISIGAVVGRRICANSPAVLASAARALCWAAALDLVALQLMAPLLGNSPIRLAGLVLMIAVTAGAKGVLFPIVHHLGSATAEADLGRSVSRVYLANVMGSALGPLITGFWLLDVLRVESVWALVCGATALLGLLTLAATPQRRVSWFAMPAALLALGLVLVVHPLVVIDKVAEPWQGDAPLAHLIQNKHGILHVTHGDDSDTTYGGNAYDGRINVDMAQNSNGLDRAYLMALLHNKPRRVLVIGLSTGAWTEVILGFPGVEQVDVVEINPGYREMISRYPAVAPLLSDPRVRLHIDDGRRWLRAHPQAQYDLIFQNTTFHWRAYTTLLLSHEYLSELGRHLAPGGVAAMNTTSSRDAYATALAVFPHVIRYGNFAYMSAAALQRRPDAEAVLRACRTGGKPSFGEALFTKPHVAWKLLNEPLQPAAEYLQANAGAVPPMVITDLNMISEYRHGQPPLFGLLAPLLPPTP
ncbi:spermidine synthase [Paucibacter sp. JuS9]|uniref:spermine/spermidine synthase domain-containing protein n=1 Tax=Roseateles TaxID=93681 RepID=UPI002FE5DB5D